MERTCVVCRRRDNKSSLLGFALYEGVFSIVLEAGSLGRCFHLHPRCFGNKKLLGALEFQLKRFSCAREEHAFIDSSVHLLEYLEKKIADSQGRNRLLLDKIKMAQEACGVLKQSLAPNRSPRLNTEKKEIQAKAKIRL